MTLMLSGETWTQSSGLDQRSGAGRGAVLVVDDDEAMRRLLGEALRDEGHEVVEATDGQEAMRLLADGGAYDIIVTDHRVPVASGMDLMRMVRATSWHTQVVIISGFADVHPGLDAGRCGAAAVLPKPFSLGVLLETVRRLSRRGA